MWKNLLYVLQILIAMGLLNHLTIVSAFQRPMLFRNHNCNHNQLVSYGCYNHRTPSVDITYYYRSRDHSSKSISIISTCLYQTTTTTANNEYESSEDTTTTKTSSSYEYALLFDCDGVILETEELHRIAYNEAFRHFNCTIQNEPIFWSVRFPHMSCLLCVWNQNNS
jgi:hypothetical protein